MIFNEQEMKTEKLDDVIEYALLDRCRREFLLNYFDESFDCKHDGICDMCAILKGQKEREEALQARRKRVKPPVGDRASATPKRGTGKVVSQKSSQSSHSPTPFTLSVSRSENPERALVRI